MLRRHFLTYLSISTAAVSQPLFAVYSRDITIFSAAKVTSVETFLFICTVAFLPALFCVFVDRLSSAFGPRVNESVRLVLIAGLSLLVGLAIGRWLQVDGDIALISIGVAFSIAGPIAFDRSKAIRVWTRWMSVFSIAVVTGVVVATWPVLMETNGPTSDAVVGNKNVTVLQIIFDEFPLFALLDDYGEINAVRFPGFAELARDATWYRNSVGVSNGTAQAVPALLSSQVPKTSGGPFLTQYPKNIFTLFAGRASIGGNEPVTSLCPNSVCPKNEQDTAIVNGDRFRDFIVEALNVYGHTTFPSFIRKHLQPIWGAWGAFEVNQRVEGAFSSGALAQVDVIEQAVRSVTSDETPQIQVVHALFPHSPWQITPDLRVNDPSPVESLVNPDDDARRDVYQTFLYQVGAADRVIQNLINDLKASRKWDSTLLVVSADHGVSFKRNVPRRETDLSDGDQVSDIYRVPTFIKYPRQSVGRTDDCAISNLDLLPTIIDVTQTVTLWKFAGLSVAEKCPEGRVRRVWSNSGRTSVLTGGFEEVLDRARSYGRMVSNVGPLSRIAAIGKSASLIGAKIGNQPVDGRITSWTVQQKQLFLEVNTQRGSAVPALISGEIFLKTPLQIGTEGIIVIDGVGAGVVGELSGASDVVAFTAVLDYTLLTAGSHTVQLYIRDTEGKLTSVGTPD
jgi:hypothetical protein